MVGVCKGFGTCLAQGKYTKSINGSDFNYTAFLLDPPFPSPAGVASRLVAANLSRLPFLPLSCQTGPLMCLKLIHSLSRTALRASLNRSWVEFWGHR